jgi:hypothetical protein
VSARSGKRLNAGRFWLLAVLVLAAVLGSRDILDEGSGMPIGDMPRYLMNGLFLYDLIGSGGAWSVDELVNRAELYYARYPALSLGHHPPLLYVSLVPFFALFGISVLSARLASLAFFLLATWGFYALTKRIAGERPAVWGTLLFVTNVFVVRFGQYTLSEVPMLALVLLSLNALLAYCDSRRPRDFVWFVLAASASLYAKQHAIFVFPLYAAILWSKLGWRALVTRHVAAWTAIGAVLSAPAIVMAIWLAPSNFGVVAWNLNTLAAGEREQSTIELVWAIVRTHVSMPVALAALGGFVTLCVRRHGQAALVGAVWLVCGIAGPVISTGPVESARYAFVAMPAYFLLAAGLSAPQWSSRLARIAVPVALAGVLAWQGWLVRSVRPIGSGGYEDVARYVAAHSSTPVLYDSPVDTGFFVFFVRKHDPAAHLVVLRAEKLLTGAGEDGRPIVGSTQDVVVLLKRYGVRYVVLEDRDRWNPARQRLRELTQGELFAERLRVPIRTQLPQSAGIDLVVYEFLEAEPPDLDADLHIALPRAGRNIRLRLRDLY